MSRKDFELISAVLKNSKPGTKPTDDDYADQWTHTVLKFADALRTTNQQFNRQRFLKACGIF